MGWIGCRPGGRAEVLRASVPQFKAPQFRVPQLRAPQFRAPQAAAPGQTSPSGSPRRPPAGLSQEAPKDLQRPVENLWKKPRIRRQKRLTGDPRRRHLNPLGLSYAGLPTSSPPTPYLNLEGCKTSWQRVENGVEDRSGSAVFRGGTGDARAPADRSSWPSCRDVGNWTFSDASSTSPRRSSPPLPSAEPLPCTSLTAHDRIVLHGLGPPLLRR